jgi:hypothetical protein
MIEPWMPGHNTTAPTERDIGFEGLGQCGQDDLTSKWEVGIDQSFR